MAISKMPQLSAKQRTTLLGAALLAVGAAGGAGAMSLQRPSVEMAPAAPTAVAKLGQAQGIVSVKGRVAEVYGDRFIVDDSTGRVMVDAGREGSTAASLGSTVLVQGRYDNGQLRARFLVDSAGNVQEVGPRPHHGPGPGPGPRPGPDGPPPRPDRGPQPPHLGPDAPPPPPPGAAPGAPEQPAAAPPAAPRT